VGVPRVVRGEGFLAELRTHELFDPFGCLGGAEAAPDLAPRGLERESLLVCTRLHLLDRQTNDNSL